MYLKKEIIGERYSTMTTKEDRATDTAIRNFYGGGNPIEKHNLPKLYCPSLWKSAHVDVDGYITPCCIFIQPDLKEKRVEDVDRIETVMIEDFQKYRDDLESGKWPSGCNQCKFAEEEGRSSKRIQDLHMLAYQEYNPETGRREDVQKFKTEPLNVALEYLQLKTGRLCNLECTICTPACSTSIATDHLKRGLIDRATYKKYNDEIQWSYDIESFKKMDSDYFRIDISGGEPLMNKVHMEWLDHLSKVQDVSKTELIYNTNGTQRPSEEEIQIWERFKGVKICFSIDSYGKKFEFLRVNAIWDEVLANMKWMEEYVVQQRLDPMDGKSNTSIGMTIHKGNIFDTIKLYEIIRTNINYGNPEPLNFNYLYYPDTMAIHSMSKERLEKAVKHFDDNMHRLPRDRRIYLDHRNLRNTMARCLEERNTTLDESYKMPQDHRTGDEIITDDI